MKKVRVRFQYTDLEGRAVGIACTIPKKNAIEIHNKINEILDNEQKKTKREKRKNQI